MYLIISITSFVRTTVSLGVTAMSRCRSTVEVQLMFQMTRIESVMTVPHKRHMFHEDFFCQISALIGFYWCTEHDCCWYNKPLIFGFLWTYLLHPLICKMDFREIICLPSLTTPSDCQEETSAILTVWYPNRTFVRLHEHLIFHQRESNFESLWCWDNTTNTCHRNEFLRQFMFTSWVGWLISLWVVTGKWAKENVCFFGLLGLRTNDVTWTAGEMFVVWNAKNIVEYRPRKLRKK